MVETFHSNSGSVRHNGQTLAVRLPLALVGFVALACCGLAVWSSRSTWERLDQFEQEFTGLKAESFYLGVRMRSQIHTLNETLLRYRLRADTNDAMQFRAEASAMRTWLESSRTNIVTPLEQGFFDEVTAAYEEYEAGSLNLLESGFGWLQSTKAKEFKASYEKVQNQSQHLLKLCDEYITGQRAAFDAFVEESRLTLSSFRWLLKLSLVLVLSLAGALMVLVYRGLIAPLRHRLTESQAIIARQEKLASLGSLAAGVAHEIRNPLTAIKVRLFSLNRSLSEAGVDAEDAEVIGGEISRLERIVREFLHFARPAEPELVDAPAARILSEVRDLLRPQLEKASITVQIEANESLWVRADTAQIKQVLINLIQNAAESIERNGVIKLRVRAGPALAGKPAGANVAIEVSDSGKGIPPDVQKRLFDPFFTTKEGGTGLGLSTAARIIEKHGGELRYETELNRGTTFRIILPRACEHAS